MPVDLAGDGTQLLELQEVMKRAQDLGSEFLILNFSSAVYPLRPWASHLNPLNTDVFISQVEPRIPILPTSPCDNQMRQHL